MGRGTLRNAFLRTTSTVIERASIFNPNRDDITVHVSTSWVDISPIDALTIQIQIYSDDLAVSTIKVKYHSVQTDTLLRKR